MNPDLLENGRRLETRVADLMQFLAGIQSDLAAITDSPAAARAGAALAEQRTALEEAIGELHQGQVRLEQRLQEHVLELAKRETALEGSRSQLRALTRRLVQVQEVERRTLARDLHDTASQGMTVLGLGLSMLKRECGCVGSTRARVEDLQEAAARVSEDLHRLSANLRPGTLDRYGLAPAAEELAAALREQAGIEVEFAVEGLERRLPGDVEIALYRIVQEACTNITRYAGARHAWVTLRRDAGKVSVTVEDDGRGFDVAESAGRGGLGLLGMRERAEMLGGHLIVDARPGQGTRLQVEAPVGAAAEGSPANIAPRQKVAPAERGLSSDVAELARAKTLSDALVEITAGASQLTDEKELLSFVLGRAAEAVGCDYAVIAVLRGRRWIVTHGYGLPPAMIGQRLVPSAVPLAAELERTGGVLVVNDTHGSDPLAVAARESGVFAGAGVALMMGGRFLAAAAFAHIADPVPFQPSEVAFLRQLSGVMALVLENSQLRG